MNRLNWNAFNTRNLRLRVISALIIMPFVLGAVYMGGIAYPILIAAGAVLGLHEWRRMVDPLTPRGVSYVSDGLLLATLATCIFLSPLWGVAVCGLGALFLLLFAGVQPGAHPRWRAGRWIALGLPYLGGCGLALFYIRALPTGTELVFYILFVVWGTDVGAYVAGRLIGGPKLAPIISPNKTWAGLGGGMALAALCGYAVATFFGAEKPAMTAVLAAILAIISQIGDLFESLVKRRSGVKESGHLIPGHGGILDRIDGLIFAAIAFSIFLRAGGTQLAWW